MIMMMVCCFSCELGLSSNADISFFSSFFFIPSTITCDRSLSVVEVVQLLFLLKQIFDSSVLYLFIRNSFSFFSITVSIRVFFLQVYKLHGIRKKNLLSFLISSTIEQGLFSYHMQSTVWFRVTRTENSIFNQIS